MGMEYIYATLLLHEAGKEITEDNIKKILESVGVEVNEAMLKAVVSSLEGVDINKVKEEALAAPVAAAPQPQAAQQTEEKKEEKPKEEEKKEEEALEGLGSLFGF